MKLTPLDIHHKEFHHALRGYSEEEVDQFLDEVADEFERLFKENIDLSEKLEATNAKVRDYQSMEVTLNNTLVSAQRSSEQIVAQANEDASTIMRDAEVKAKEIIHGALTEKQKVQSELVRIKQAEEDFRARFRALLEQHLGSISEVTLPQDVTVLIGETERGVVSDVDVHLSALEIEPLAPAPEPVAAVSAAAAQVPEPTRGPVPEPTPPVVPEPVAEIPEPVAEIPEPVAEIAEPVAEIAEPVAEIAEPVAEIAEPTPPPAPEPAPQAAVFGAGAEPIDISEPFMGPEPSPEPGPEPAVDFATEPAREPASASADFVTSVDFGELESPDLGAEEPFGEPREFSMPSFDAFGERDDDLDIEEID